MGFVAGGTDNWSIDPVQGDVVQVQTGTVHVFHAQTVSPLLQLEQYRLSLFVTNRQMLPVIAIVGPSSRAGKSYVTPPGRGELAIHLQAARGFSFRSAVTERDPVLSVVEDFEQVLQPVPLVIPMEERLPLRIDLLFW